MGHALWHDGLLCDVLEGRMLGKRKEVKKDTVTKKELHRFEESS